MSTTEKIFLIYRPTHFCVKHSKAARAGLARAAPFFCFVFLLYGYNAENVLADYHEDEVENPDDVPAENQTDKTCNYFALHKPGYETAYPRSYGDNSKNYADEIT